MCVCVCGSGEACSVVMSDIKHSCHITGTTNELRAVTPTAATADLWSYWLNSSDTAPLPGLDQSGVQICLPSAQSFFKITLVGLCPLKPFFKTIFTRPDYSERVALIISGIVGFQWKRTFSSFFHLTLSSYCQRDTFWLVAFKIKMQLFTKNIHVNKVIKMMIKKEKELCTCTIQYKWEESDTKAHKRRDTEIG